MCAARAMPTGEGLPFAEGAGVMSDALFDLHAEGSGELADQIRRVAPLETTVLLCGETGTGKTFLARTIHRLSPRRDEPFLVVDCGALSSGLIESEVFGHARGAFTGADRDRPGKFAAAGNGTLLLDEVNTLPPPVQAKLLRAVDERVFEPVGSNRPQPLQARLIAASNAPLDQEVAAGRFRPDLYHRLNVVAFTLPPLRARRAAIVLLAHQLLAVSARQVGRRVGRIAADALRALEQYDWPGNVRQLRNVVERAVALGPGPDVELADLPEAFRPGNPGDARRPAPGAIDFSTRPPSSLRQNTEATEVRRITEALRKHNDNRLRAAAELGISRMALYKKLHKYGLMERC